MHSCSRTRTDDGPSAPGSNAELADIVDLFLSTGLGMGQDSGHSQFLAACLTL